MTRLVILDRDGVINHESAEFVKRPAEWRPIDGSLEAIGRLTRAGCTVCVATNQSGLGRGLFSRETLYAMHRKLRRLAARHGGRIARIVFCPHLPGAGCDCRKPRPGLLLRLARHYAVRLDDVPVVGDSLRDLDAAEAAGARPVLVLTGNGEQTQASLHRSHRQVETYASLADFAAALVGHEPAASGRN